MTKKASKQKKPAERPAFTSLGEACTKMGLQSCALAGRNASVNQKTTDQRGRKTIKDMVYKVRSLAFDETTHHLELRLVGDDEFYYLIEIVGDPKEEHVTAEVRKKAKIRKARGKYKFVTDTGIAIFVTFD